MNPASLKCVNWLSLLRFEYRCCICVEVGIVCFLKSCLNKSLVLGVPVASCSNSNRSNTFYRCCFLIPSQVYSSQPMKFGSDIIDDKDHSFISSRQNFKPCYLSSAQKLQPHSKNSRISQWRDRGSVVCFQSGVPVRSRTSKRSDRLPEQIDISV